MAGQGGEKTEQASPRKRDDERKKGNIFLSKDVTTVATLLVSFYAFRSFLPGFLARMQDNYIVQIQRIVQLETLTPGDAMNLFMECGLLFVLNALPAMLIIGLVTVLAVGAQTRFLFASELIKFKMERIDPLKGMMKLFSMRSLIELLKSLIKITVLAMLLYRNVEAVAALLPSMFDWEVDQAAQYVGQEIMGLVTSVGIAFGAIAALDFLYQRWEYEKGIRMSKQEVKDEYKQMEGNPEVKSARRQKQREFATGRMMQQVQEADVIVRNPTHFAVALRYDLEKDFAPTVLAKGKDLVALRIVEEGEKHGITTVENKPLARGLYELGDIDEMIPPELYQPVAELLAWLFTVKDKEKETFKQ